MKLDKKPDKTSLCSGVLKIQPMRNENMEHRDVTLKTDALWIQYTDLMVETGMVSDWVKNETSRNRDAGICPPYNPDD
jgi:hypothetical protein